MQNSSNGMMFLKEEKGQSAIEYILLAGGIIVAALVIFVIYSKLTKSSAKKFNSTSDSYTSVTSSKISAEVVNLY
jgi:Flp pilus assembly pilin Flp